MSVTFAKGFEAAGVVAGISSQTGKQDVALVVNNGPLDAAAGVFTSNRFCAAPVQWSRKVVADGHVKAVILNSGGANACTGEAGYAQSVATAETVAGLIGAEPNDVAVCSTGLIGELLPLDNVLAGAKSAHEALAATAEAGADASHAIMTTDTKPKTVELTGSNGWKIGGMVKGSGMIAPQLATMLCVITTDAVERMFGGHGECGLHLAASRGVMSTSLRSRPAPPFSQMRTPLTSTVTLFES